MLQRLIRRGNVGGGEEGEADDAKMTSVKGVEETNMFSSRGSTLFRLRLTVPRNATAPCIFEAFPTSPTTADQSHPMGYWFY